MKSRIGQPLLRGKRVCGERSRHGRQAKRVTRVKKLWGLGAVFKMIATGGAGSIFDDADSAEVEGRLTVAVTGAGVEAATRVEAGCNARSSVAGAAAANLLAANSMAQTMASFTRAPPASRAVRLH